MQVHYESTFFKQDTLREAAHNYLRWLPKDVNTLISTGSSGCAIASAMITLATRSMRHIFIRKTYDLKIHTSKFVGYDYGMPDRKCAIVDDFISNGKTIRRIINAAPEKNLSVTIVLVGNAIGFNSRNVIEKLERQFHIQIIIV